MNVTDSGVISRCINPKRIINNTVHCHKEHELYYLVKGSAVHYSGDRIFHLKQGDFLFVPKGILHKMRYEEYDCNERVLLFINDNIFTSELQGVRDELYQYRLVHIQPEKQLYFNELLQKMEEEYRCNDGYASVLFRLHVAELLVQICRYKCPELQELSGTDQTMYLVSRYIRKNLGEQLSLDVLCREVSMSKYHLSRKFKEYTGIGINEYITYARITKAEKLLRETKLPISRVSEICGYNDSNYFSVAFKRIKGITPQQYRCSEGTQY